MPPVSPLFHTYALCCVVLSFQMLFLAGLTAARRSTAKRLLNPEDSAVAFKGAEHLEAPEPESVARVMRAHRNMNESLPIFFGLGFVFLFVGGSTLGGQICFVTFTAGRLLHSVAYLNALQPWRTIAYAVSAFALVGMMVQIVMATL